MTNAYPLAVSDPDACVYTKAGALQGVYEDGVRIFRGVPFAAPPVGQLRFRAPQPAEPWAGTRPAHRSGAASAQISSANRERVLARVRELDPGVPGIFPWPDYAMATYDQPASDEDCLYLDVWAPAERGDERLPVLVYYHGGANAVSSGSFSLERGANFARDQRVIVVRPNYRMGALGWVHFGLVVAGLDEAVNLGLQDQLAALAWVRENIADFGGDPGNVTVAGESAGATAVSQILTSPPGRAQVRRAIMQSLSPFNNWCAQQRPEAEAVARMYCDLLDVEDAEGLMSVEVDQYLAVQNIMTRYFAPDENLAWRPLGAVVDNRWLPQAPAHYLSTQRGELNGIDVVIGFAKDEWQFFRGHSDTARAGTKPDVLAVLRQVFGADAEAVYDRYAAMHPGRRPGHLLSDVMSFEFFKLSSLAIAQNLADQGAPAWVFQFSWDLPGLDGELRAVHTGDMPFLWSNYGEQELARWPIFDGIDRAHLGRIARTFGEFYGNFIRAGDPGPAWPPFSRNDHEILWLGKTGETRRGSLDDELSVFASTRAATVDALEAILTANVRSALRVGPLAHPPTG
jgi:para-nitrobenzyl esterase